LKNGDSSAIAKAAHALKSMSLNVGARRLALACSAIEDAARNNAEKSEIVKLCKLAAQEFRDTHRALPATLQEYQNAAA
jgi:two-component system sensor histidine kinase BarA